MNMKIKIFYVNYYINLTCQNIFVTSINIFLNPLHDSFGYIYINCASDINLQLSRAYSVKFISNYKYGHLQQSMQFQPLCNSYVQR